MQLDLTRISVPVHPGAWLAACAAYEKTLDTPEKHADFVKNRFPKLLLTATPLQNSLEELFGLCSIVDDRVFGDLIGFKARLMRGAPDYGALRERVRPVLHRTLRKDVLADIKYTERHALTQKFKAPSAERRLYDDVCAFLAEDELVSLPRSQRGLVSMAIRKLLASSSDALAGVLSTVRKRLQRLADHQPVPPFDQDIDDGIDDAWLDELLDPADPPADKGHIYAEIARLGELVAAANVIEVDQRARALIDALRVGFRRLADHGAPRKAVVFTESRRTQAMLFRHLEANGYAGQVVCFHGGGADEASNTILDRWVARHPDLAGTASRAANLRAAIIDHFEHEASILIATEAGAEGLNLQFCAMVVNYDLPWNPQRVEQRIGRCHRYGQRHDVVVVNLIEETNAADLRVLELLTEKFKLFDGVFGASDAIIGALESGVGFEQRVHRIFDTCRTAEQIEAAFAALRRDLEADLTARDRRARKDILDPFDADVHDRLKVQLSETEARLNRMERWFLDLTRWALASQATFAAANAEFMLNEPVHGIPAGRYELLRRTGNRVSERYVYRLTHPLGAYVLGLGATAATPDAHLVFDLSGHPVRLAAVEALKGRRGFLRLTRVRITGFADEEHLVFSGTIDGGGSLDPESCERLFQVGAIVQAPKRGVPAELDAASRHGVTVATSDAAARTLRDVEAARERVYRWAEDMVLSAEETVKALRKQERDLDKEARSAPTLEDKRAILVRLSEVEAKKGKARHARNDIEDDAHRKQEAVIEELDRRATQRVEIEPLFTVSWDVL